MPCGNVPPKSCDVHFPPHEWIFSEWMSPSWVLFRMIKKKGCRRNSPKRMPVNIPKCDFYLLSSQDFDSFVMSSATEVCASVFNLRFFFRHACLAMTSIVDSRAHFLKRCSDMGMTDRAINHLVQGMLTMGKIAFSVGSRGIHWTI